MQAPPKEALEWVLILNITSYEGGSISMNIRNSSSANLYKQNLDLR